MKRKIKSLKKLLEEFPDAHFNRDGYLIFPSLKDDITPTFFWYLGKEGEDFHYWPEEFLEPLPEKKVIRAYCHTEKDTDLGLYRWFDHELHSNSNFKRVPELDIVKEVEE